MTSTDQLQALLDEPRNGCNAYIRHPLVKKFIYTDGVQEMAKLCGAYWLLGIIATEAVPALLREFAKEDGYNRGIVSIKVGDAQVAAISLAVEDDALPHLGTPDRMDGFPHRLLAIPARRRPGRRARQDRCSHEPDPGGLKSV